MESRKNTTFCEYVRKRERKKIYFWKRLKHQESVKQTKETFFIECQQKSGGTRGSRKVSFLHPPFIGCLFTKVIFYQLPVSVILVSQDYNLKDDISNLVWTGHTLLRSPEDGLHPYRTEDEDGAVGGRTEVGYPLLQEQLRWRVQTG